MSKIYKYSSIIILTESAPRPFDLDDAVLRRLPRRILVDLPGPKEREGMFNFGLHTKFFTHDHEYIFVAYFSRNSQDPIAR